MTRLIHTSAEVVTGERAIVTTRTSKRKGLFAFVAHLRIPVELVVGASRPHLALQVVLSALVAQEQVVSGPDTAARPR